MPISISDSVSCLIRHYHRYANLGRGRVTRCNIACTEHVMIDVDLEVSWKTPWMFPTPSRLGKADITHCC